MVAMDVAWFMFGVLLLAVNLSLSAVMYTEVVLYDGDDYPLGTVRPLYRTGVSLLSRERFLYI
jgi:hypothetical protein